MKKSERDDKVSDNQRSFEVFVFFVLPFMVMGVATLLGLDALIRMVIK